MTIHGELCSGIAYIDWEKLHSTPARATDSPLTRCIGRYHQFVQPASLLDPEEVRTEAAPERASSKYVRAFGSTAILYLPRDSFGRERAVARSVGPLQNGSASEIGPIEESVVDWMSKVEKEGIESTVVEPMKILLERSGMVAKRSVSMFINSIFPFSGFVDKMKVRVPELVKETYDLASSIRIEIKIEDHRPADQEDEK